MTYPRLFLIYCLALSACVTMGRPDLDSPAMVRIEPGRSVAGSGSAETSSVHYPVLNTSREQPSRLVTIEAKYDDLR